MNLGQKSKFGLVWLAGLLLVGACSGGSTGVKPNPVDSGNGADQVTSDVAPNSDGGTGGDANRETGADSDGGDGPAGTDATGDAMMVECAPLPTGGPRPAGLAPMQPAGPVVASTPTRPELAASIADDRYTMRKALAQAGLIAVSGAADGGVSSADGGGGISAPLTGTYALTDNWDPLTNGIGDPATFTPMFTVATDGTGTHASINAAVAAAILLAPCSRVYIRLKAGIYREQVTVASKASAPPLTLYSTETDASKTRIVFNAAAVTSGNMSASATFTVKALTGFQVKNLTIANDYAEDAAVAGDQSAVALLNQADRAQFENVRVIGNIAPLYLKSLEATQVARSYFRDCYVEGDQDIIIGRGTAVFDHTEIKYLTGRQPAGGVIAFPSTLIYNQYGFLFESCQFTAEAGASGVFLGHQWLESGNPAVVGKMIVRNSTLGGHIAAAPWTSMGNRTTTPKVPSGTTPLLVFTSDDYYPAGVGPTPAEPYLAEYGNSGPGAHQ